MNYRKQERQYKRARNKYFGTILFIIFSIVMLIMLGLFHSVLFALIVSFIVLIVETILLNNVYNSYMTKKESYDRQKSLLNEYNAN